MPIETDEEYAVRISSLKDAKIKKLENVNTDLLEALESASEHLDYCGYGDRWEKECAYADKLPEKIEKAINKAKRNNAV